MINYEIRFRVNELIYNDLKTISKKLDLPVATVVKNIVINKLVDLKRSKK